jgi:hypothetical protein
VQAEDDWCKAKLIKSRVVGIAHTELEMKSFDVSFVSSSLDEWAEDAATVELEVKSDRIRLIQGPPVVEAVKIEESTGEFLTGWGSQHQPTRIVLFKW